SDLRTLRKLYRDYGKLRYDAPSVSQGEREQLRQHLDWFGDLALAPAGNTDERDAIVALAGGPVVVGVQVEPPDPALRQTLLGAGKFLAGFVLGFFVLVLVLAFFGFIGLLLFMLLLALGKLRGGLHCGTSPAGVYIETFALWMLSFLVVGYGIAQLPL